MKRMILPSLVLAAAMVINACTPQAAEPTTSPEDIQATAVSAAFTIVAETQAAIPTQTPLPPTETPSPTPQPTDTPLPSPTLDAAVLPTFTATVAQSSSNNGGDPCNAPLPASVQGRSTKIKIVNKTKGTLVGSLYLNLTPFGECGWRGVNLGKFDAVTYTDLVQGCYNVSVFVNGNEGKDTKAFGGGCINNPDLWTFEVYADYVKFIGP